MTKYTDREKLHTFSIGFDGKYDETPYINIVKNHFHTNHHHYYFTREDFDALIDKFAYIYDEPFWDYSGFPTYKVSELAKKYVSVTLSGDGGDEIFGGYNSHVTGYRMDILYKFPGLIKKLLRILPAKKNLNGFASLYLLKEAAKITKYSKENFYAQALADEGIKTDIFKKRSIEKLQHALQKGGGKLGEALRIYDLLYNTMQNNFLVKVDRASMSHALEVRSPFLDYRLMEYAQIIPIERKVDITKTKKLMRDIIKDLLPEEIIHRNKQGFSPPINEWILDEAYQQDLQNALDILKDLNQDLYQFYANKVFHEQHELYTNYKIRLFLFAKWYKQWIDY
jgi:asparagine synthase (glutamine-hydrolysing)